MSIRTKSRKGQGDVEGATGGEESDITKAVVRALNDPVVLKSFTDNLKDMIRDEVKEQIEPYNDKLGSLEMDFEQSRKAHDAKLNKIQTDIEEITGKLKVLDRLSKCCNVRVFGLSKDMTSVGGTEGAVPSSQETTQHSEVQQDEISKSEGSPAEGKNKHLIACFLRILKEVNVQGLAQEDIISVHKVTISGGDEKNNPVIFRFISEDKKDILFSQRAKLRNSTTKIFINEDLTKSDSKIFKKAREDVKKGKLFSTWTRKGVVWGKLSESGKPFTIT